MARVEIGEPALGAQILRILRQAGADAAAEHGRDIVDGFRERIGGQEGQIPRSRASPSGTAEQL